MVGEMEGRGEGDCGGMIVWAVDVRGVAMTGGAGDTRDAEAAGVGRASSWCSRMTPSAAVAHRVSENAKKSMMTRRDVTGAFICFCLDLWFFYGYNAVHL